MVKIKLTRGMTAIVDDEYRHLSKFKWLASGRKFPYAVRTESGKCIRMHRLILNAQDGQLVDHINGNTLDNRVKNLRIITRSGNSRNKRPTGSSRFLGVCKRANGKWFASIKVDKKYVYLGLFENEIDAAKAYDDAIDKFKIEYGRKNFPEQD